MFLLIDFGYYWFHRFTHEWNGLWAAHIVHHNSEEYNLSTALRQGALQPFTRYAIQWFDNNIIVGAGPSLERHSSQWNFWSYTHKLTHYINSGFIRELSRNFHLVWNGSWTHQATTEFTMDATLSIGTQAIMLHCWLTSDKNYGGTLIIFDRIFGTFEPENQEVARLYFIALTGTGALWNHTWSRNLESSVLSASSLARNMADIPKDWRILQQDPSVAW